MATVSTQSSSTPQISPSTVEPSLLDTCKKFNAAFNRADVKEVAAFWDSEGTLIGPTGNRGSWRSGVERVYADDVNQFLRGTTSTFTIETVRPIGRDLALLDLDHTIQGARLPDGTSGTMKLHTVILARRQGTEWRWLDARPYGFLPSRPAAPVH
jgi:ketosteroid isomerase-like protein